jgi:TonB family protein
VRTLETWLLNYAVNALWQVPIVFAAAWIAARTSRRAGPAFQHGLWTSALVAEVLLPACTARPGEAWQMLLQWLASFRQSSIVQDPHVTVTMGPAHAAAGFHMPPMLLAAVALLYLGALVYFATRLCIGLYQTNSLRRRAEPLALSGDARQSYHRFAQIFEVRDATLATSTEIAGPITLGVRRPVLLLPSALDTNLLGEDLDAALAHEFAHMRRRDFAKNLLYEVLSLPIAFHPLLRLTRSRMAETRELVCDAMAADVVAGRQRYARSLLRLATKFSEQAHAPTPHAIGIFDAHPFKNFERRVMNLTHNSLELRGAARVATAAVSLLLIGGACTSALAFRLQVAVPPSQTTNAVQGAVVAGPSEPMHVGGNIKKPTVIYTVDPEYSPQARRAKFSGNVEVYLWVDKDGHPSHVRVVRGVGLGLDEKAVEAVRQYKFKPATLDGKPVTVDLYVDISFNIAGASSPVHAANFSYAAASSPIRTVSFNIAGASSPIRTVNFLIPAVAEPTQIQPGSTARIGAGVMAGERTSYVEPVYPEAAKKAKMNGTVVLEAVIGKDGKIKSLKVISATDPMFNNASLDAVRQWTYRPYLLNGDPTEVDTTITVNFALNK